MKTNTIEITPEDKKAYGSASVPASNNNSIEIIKDRFESLRKPIDLPRIPTMGDTKLDGTITVQDQKILNSLAAMFPTTSFNNLTSNEAMQIHNYNDVVKTMTREQIWHIMKPYFPSIFTLPLGDISSKMTEIARRSDNNPDYLPTMEWLDVIAKRILDARKDLFTHNIDLNTKRFNHRDNPIGYLLMLIKIQKEMYPKRHQKLSSSFLFKFKLLVQSHAELMVKLKMAGKQPDDFFGSKYDKIKNSLRTLKDICYKSYGGKPLSIKQQQALINIIDEYHKTLDMIFTIEPDLKDIFDDNIPRVKKNATLCSLEVYHTFDDTATSRGSYYGKQVGLIPSANETINTIFLKVKKGESLNVIYRNGISMQNLNEFITDYFRFINMIDRNIIRQKEVNGSNTARQMIVNQFFDILDKYML